MRVGRSEFSEKTLVTYAIKDLGNIKKDHSALLVEDHTFEEKEDYLSPGAHDLRAIAGI